ncbi:MAG: CHAT domain-containing tetratricopeptide repeat protein [Pseudomonadota bacterium]
MRADAIHAQGEIAFFLEDAITTTSKLEAAAELYESLSLFDDQATALNSLGLWYQEHLQRDAAYAAFDRAAAAVRSAPLQARIQSNRCLVAIDFRQLSRAENCLNEALVLARAAQDAALIMNVRYFQAGVYSSRGESHKALPPLLEVLERKDELSWNRLGTVQNNIALQYARLGESAKALTFYSAAVESNRRNNQKNREALNLRNLGSQYAILGDNDRARKFFGESIRLAQQIGELRLLADALLSLLAVERIDGNLDSAAAVLGELDAINVDSPDIAFRTEIARARLGIATGDRSMTARGISAADEIGRDLDSRILSQADLLVAKVRFAEILGNANAADEALTDAVAAFEAQRDPIALAWVFGVVAKRALERGDLDAADDAAQTADRYFQPVRSRIANPDLRARWGGEAIDYNDVLVATAMRRHAREPDDGHDKEALARAIAARAQVLSDTLADSEYAESSNNTELLQRRSALLLQVSRHADLERVDADARRLTDLLLELDQIDNRLAAANPRRAGISGTASIDIDAIAAELGDDAALLTIHLGESIGFAWLLDRTGITSTAISDLDAVEQLSVKIANGLKTRRSVTTAISELSAMLIPGTPEPSVKTLYVSVDGVLSYLPLELLSNTGSNDRLGERFNVVYQTAPGMLQRSHTAKTAQKNIRMTVIADPIFAADDPRVRTSASESVPVESAAATTTSFNDTYWNRLPYAAREADAIVDAWPSARVTQFRADKANRDVVLALGNERTDIVHIAAHGVVNSERPELTGIMLSRFDADGRPMNGFVGVRDIYSLDTDAQLVVLSACDTALGREIRGEGLAGLSRAFLYAGAEQVVASLWQVSDGATAALMTHFYEEYIATGDAAAALANAKQTLRRIPRWRDPYFWSGFVLYGLR